MLIVKSVSYSATCRRPIKGAAARPINSCLLWNDENLFSPKITKSTSSSSSYTESCIVNRINNLPPSTSLNSSSSSSRSAAPPAGQTKAATRSTFQWIKLLLLVIVATFLFLVYQAMETNGVNPFDAANTGIASGSTV